MVLTVSVEELRPEKRAFGGRVGKDSVFTLERASPKGRSLTVRGAHPRTASAPLAAISAPSIEAPAHAPPAPRSQGLSGLGGAGQRRNPRRRRTRQTISSSSGGRARSGSSGSATRNGSVHLQGLWVIHVPH